MVILLSISFLFLMACPSVMPVFQGRLYQGDSAKVGISRNNPNEEPEFISASSQDFDAFTCTKTHDLVLYLEEVQKALSNCKRWKGDK